jgi:UDP:flavonoid glycosyltransferase YjiC (YdhE family)
VAFIPGLSAQHRALLEGPGRLVSDELVRVDRLLPGCDLVISHAGGIAPGTMLAGVPQLTLPQHYEQFLTARRIEQMGAGGWIGTGVGPDVAQKVLDTVLAQPRFREAAQAFAKRYRTFSADEQKRRIVKRIEDLLAA